MAEINPHPALKAAVPRKPDGRHLDGRRRFPQRRLPRAARSIFPRDEHRQGRRGARIARGRATITRAISRPVRPATSREVGHRPGARPCARSWRTRPTPTSGQLQAVDKWIAARPLTVPTMLEVGQWDQEDSYGAPAVYRALKDQGRGQRHGDLVIGPWRHSGANHYGYELGALTFTGDTALQWRTQYMKPFFDHYLKGAPDPHTPPVLTYATGINKWEDSPTLADGHADAALSLGAGIGRLRPPGGRRARRLRLRPGQAGAVPAAPDHMGDSDQWQAWLVARPALRRRPARRASATRARRSTSRCTSWARRRSTCSPRPAGPTATGWSS